MRRLALAFLLLLVAAARAAEAPEDFAATAPIALDGGGPYFRVELPMAVRLAARSPTLADLRIFNGAGEAVPFGIVRSRPATDEALERSALRWFPLYRSSDPTGASPEIRVERGADGTVVAIREGERPAGAATPALRGYILDASDNKNAIRVLELDWDAAQTGLQQLSVEASDDLQHWRRWRDGAELARLEFQGEHLERRRIDLRGERANYLRLTWESPTTAPGLTEAVLITSRATHRPAAMVWSEAMTAARDANGDYVWELSQRVPVEQLKLELADVNVLAPAQIWESDGGGEGERWQLVASPVLYRLMIEGKEWQQGEIALAGAPARRLKLTLDRRGSGIGAGTLKLSIGATAEQVLFLARGSGPFRLAIGNPAASAADLAPATLIPGYESAAAPPIAAARLGALALGTPAASVAAPGEASFRWQTAALWGVLLLGVAFIGVTAFGLLRQTK